MASKHILNVSLTEELWSFVVQQVKTGRFRTASEFVRTALRLLEGGALVADRSFQLAGQPQCVSLGFELIQTFGLALHELATNAVKYGALGKDAGRLDVSWVVRSEGEAIPVLVLDWRENGIRNLVKPSRRGFGRDLIEKALRFTLKAKSDLVFGEEGVSCHIELPLSATENKTLKH